MHHPKADIDRLYVKRKGGGRGLLETEVTYKAEIINIAEYLNTKYKEDRFVNIVKNQESSQPNMNSTIKTAVKVAEELNQMRTVTKKKEGIQCTKAILGESLKKVWESKVMHAEYIRNWVLALDVFNYTFQL